MNAQRSARPSKPTSKQQRLVALAERVLELGAAPMQELADHLGVARMTVYRDVAELEQAGVLSLRHGVAVAGVSSFTETAHSFRSALNQSTKRALCAAVVGRVRPGSTIFLDDSSTLLPLVPMLVERAPITIITHSQAVAVEASRHPELRLFVTGGAYRPAYDSYAGATTLATLRSLSADLCIMSSTAISQGVLFHPLEENASVKQAMIERSTTAFLLADASKFGHRATHQVCTLDAFDLLVVTEGVSPEELADLTPELVTV